MKNSDTFVGKLTVSAAPHIVTSMDTQKTMLMVLIALIPSFIASIIVFGARPILLMAVCVIACAFFEWGYEALLKKEKTVKDLSACVTGAILALNLPANFPVWMAIIGCFVSIVIVKMLYGGIGRNFANPAIVGRIVLLLSFTTQMTSWPVTRFAATDAVTGATPLGLLQSGLFDQLPSNMQMFVGAIGGAMGEISVIAVLIGGIFLIAKKIISPLIPVSVIATVFVFALIYYGATGGAGDYNALHMAIFHVCAGGIMFGAFFCATDYATSPIMPLAKVIYGCAIGAVTMIIRLWCSYPEGASFAILFMNIMTPLIDNAVQKKYYKKLYGDGGVKNEK